MPADSLTVHVGNKERYGWKPSEPNALDRLLDEMRRGAFFI